MPPDRFEALIGELLIQMGFDERTVEVTRRSGGCGLDALPRQRQLFRKEGALLWTTHFMSLYNLPLRSFYSIKTQKMDTSASSWTSQESIKLRVTILSRLFRWHFAAHCLMAVA